MCDGTATNNSGLATRMIGAPTISTDNSKSAGGKAVVGWAVVSEGLSTRAPLLGGVGHWDGNRWSLPSHGASSI